jgi:hypothetical protein
MRWGDRHLAGIEGPPIVLRHNDCGELADPHLTCRHCHEEITAHNLTPEAGPGFRDAPIPTATPSAADIDN